LQAMGGGCAQEPARSATDVEQAPASQQAACMQTVEQAGCRRFAHGAHGGRRVLVPADDAVAIEARLAETRGFEPAPGTALQPWREPWRERRSTADAAHPRRQRSTRGTGCA